MLSRTVDKVQSKASARLNHNASVIAYIGKISCALTPFANRNITVPALIQNIIFRKFDIYLFYIIEWHQRRKAL